MGFIISTSNKDHNRIYTVVMFYKQVRKLGAEDLLLFKISLLMANINDKQSF